MSFWQNLFKKRATKNPEDDFIVTTTDTLITVEHANGKVEQISWNSIEQIKLINTVSGPWLPDIWLVLLGENQRCLIPQGAKGYESVYDIVSKYDGFNFENVLESMQCTDNREFDLWTKYGR